MTKLHPQAQQLFNLLFLLVIGKYVAHIYLTWQEIVGILFFTLGSEHLLLYVKHKTLRHFSFSALSTAIGVMLMMVSTHYYLYFILIFVALFQKHFMHYQTQHFFNPSNFALMMGLLFFYRDTHLVLGQLGDRLALALLVCTIAIVILYRVKRWLLPLTFTFVYLFSQYTIVVASDPMMLMENIWYRFYSVSFIVFILFMLTDPRTTPSKWTYQMVFGAALALLATTLDYMYGFRVQHMFMALFLLSPLVVLLENYSHTENKMKLLLLTATILLLSLGAIIYIEMQPPYYFEMDG